MDGIRATPYQYPLVGSVNELIGGLLGYMRDPRRTQQMQGLAGLLESTGIPKTVERLAYGEPLTNIQRANVPLLRPETAEALLTVAPVPPIAGRATMAAGRAGERLAERVVPQIMERGGMPAGLLESMSSRTVSPLTVYHGSPAKFERFDPTKIGSGEGAQAYGYGHYVAESPETADYYAKTLANQHGRKLVDKTGKELSFNNPDTEGLAEVYLRGSSGYEDAKKQLQALADSSPEYASEYKKAIEKLNDWESQGIKIGYEKEPNVYTVDLPDEQIARMLDWDKPLSQQAESVKSVVFKDIDAAIAQTKEALAKASDRRSPTTAAELERLQRERARLENLVGSDYYEQLSLGVKSGAPTASESLKQIGIPGIRYLDQGSRGTGEGTSNFVVFPGNEGLLTIQKRNNEVIAPKGLLDYRGSHTAPGPDFGAPLYDLTGGGQMYPADVYSPKAAQYYGGGVPYDQKAFDIAQSFKDKPNATVTIYRAVPKEMSNSEKLAILENQMAAYMKRGTLPKDAENYSSGSKWYDWAYDEREKLRSLPDEPANKMNINAGDWVTLTKEYAKDHGESALKGQYKILSKKVKAKDLWTNADSIHEFGYHPSE